ncbi:MAG: SpoIID/LytB domain-containing protein [Bacillota bacterium]|jgi:stage II sporulation protein D
MKKSIMMLVVVFLFLGSFSWTIHSVQAKGDDDIRVCLSQGTYSVVFKIVEGEYLLQDLGTRLPIAALKSGDIVTVNQAGKVLTININGSQITGAFTGPLTAVPEDEDELNVFSYKNTLYRDDISLSIDSGSLLVINNINIEHYLYGVVGQEIGYTAPKEALKAQAVVSRSFALYFKGRNVKYDVGTSTSTQVYGGYSAELNINGDKVIDAVDDTRGRVIYYYNEKTGRSEIIQAFFHSNAGGFTENSENVWNEALPYLRAVPSEEDRYAETYADETGESWSASTYRWEKSFTREEIKVAIQSYSQKTGIPINIGEFQSINLFWVGRDGITPTLSGRVTRMDLVGSKGKHSVYRDNIRSVFGLKSTKFDIVAEGNRSNQFVIRDSFGKIHRVDNLGSLQVITGDNRIVTLNDTDNNSGENYQMIGESGQTGLTAATSRITFIGQGYGHGVGMSQWGARGMALKGYNYKEIIYHYYNQGKDDGTISIERY